MAGAGLLFWVGSLPAPALATVFQVNDDGRVVERVNGRSIPVDEAAVEPNGTDVEVAPETPDAALTLVADPSVPTVYRESLQRAADRYSVSPSLLAALARQESGWRQSIVSPKGAVGLTQLMPPTARALAVNPLDPAANLDGGARYLRTLLDRFDGDVERALAAYNAGPGRVVRANGVPAIAETRAYVTTIIDRLGDRIDNVGRTSK